MGFIICCLSVLIMLKAFHSSIRKLSLDKVFKATLYYTDAVNINIATVNDDVNSENSNATVEDGLVVFAASAELLSLEFLSFRPSF